MDGPLFGAAMALSTDALAGITVCMYVCLVQVLNRFFPSMEDSDPNNGTVYCVWAELSLSEAVLSRIC